MTSGPGQRARSSAMSSQVMAGVEQRSFALDSHQSCPAKLAKPIAGRTQCPG